MKNQLANKKSGGVEYVDVSTMMRDPIKRARLQTYIDEVLNMKTQILDKQEQIKATRDAAVADLSVEPKMFNSLVGLFFNNNFEQKLDELNRLEQAISTLMQTTPGLQRPKDD